MPKLLEPLGQVQVERRASQDAPGNENAVLFYQAFVNDDSSVRTTIGFREEIAADLRLMFLEIAIEELSLMREQIKAEKTKGN